MSQCLNRTESPIPIRPKATWSPTHFGKLAKARPAIMGGIGLTNPMVTFKQMLTCILPQIDLNLQATRIKLIQRRVLQQGQDGVHWRHFTQPPANSKLCKPIVFDGIKHIQAAIVSNAVFSSGIRRQPTAEYISNPSQTPLLLRINNKSKPDGFGQLKQKQSQYVGHGWMDIAWAEEYKEVNSEVFEADVSHSVLNAFSTYSIA